ncbi:uncharacterized protein [Nicotiana sylvestris]|uniref:uncharacterized protein n=1 Tax=Nicotiana sylvestris TaxID=4096 RepID=UPI00388C5DD4
MVANALSRKAESMGILAFISAEERPLALDIQSLANRLVRLDISEPSRVLACVVTQSSLLGKIKARQFDDPHLAALRETVLQGISKEVSIGEDGILQLQGHLCVPNIDGLRERILEEAYSSRHSIHLNATKMYRDLRKYYWWRRMKKDIVQNMSNENQTNGNVAGTGATVTSVAASSSRSTPAHAMAPAEKPGKFSGIDFKRWQMNMLFYLTTLSLQRFIKEDLPVLAEGTPDDERFVVTEAWKHSDFLCKTTF